MRLRRMLDAARQIKDNVSTVGRNMTDGPTPNGELPLLGKRVLVVDSDERVRRQAHLLVTRLGGIVEAASSGADGVAMAADEDYDAIFQEVKPPDMGGYDCYRQLRAARPTAIVSLTTGFGYDTAHSIVKARAEGMKHVLYKPFRHDQVVKAVLDGVAAASIVITWRSPRTHTTRRALLIRSICFTGCSQSHRFELVVIVVISTTVHPSKA